MRYRYDSDRSVSSFCFQAEDGIRDLVRSRGLGDVYKRQMQDGATNQNGIYSIQCKVDDDPSFAFALDEIPFEQARYLNAHIDYRRKINAVSYTHLTLPTSDLV